MAVISLSSIISILGGGANDVFSRRNDKNYWSGWIEDQGSNRKIVVTGVSLDESGLDLVIDDAGTQISLSAVPESVKGTKVLVDNAEQPNAALVFEPKPSIGNLTRYAFDFRPIKLGGKTVRVNVRYDP